LQKWRWDRSNSRYCPARDCPCSPECAPCRPFCDKSTLVQVHSLNRDRSPPDTFAKDRPIRGYRRWRHGSKKRILVDFWCFGSRHHGPLQGDSFDLWKDGSMPTLAEQRASSFQRRHVMGERGTRASCSIQASDLCELRIRVDIGTLYRGQHLSTLHADSCLIREHG
jgi:hypothetical protein